MILIQLRKDDEHMTQPIKEIDKYQGRHPYKELPRKPNVILLCIIKTVVIRLHAELVVPPI